MPRSPRTLWIHLTLELWRLILLSTGVVLVVICFAASVKPLSDGLLQPLDTPLFMLLAMPPMLAYALPFAAGFAATMVYHRHTQENAVLAAHAGGISHHALVAPALATAIFLTGVMGVMNEQVIPRFLNSMEVLVARDVQRIITRSVDNGEPIRFGNVALHAASATSLGPDRSVGAYERIRLREVALVRTERVAPTEEDPDAPTMKVESELTATEAIVWLFRAEAIADENEPTTQSGTLAFIDLAETVGRRGRDVPIARAQRFRTGPYVIGGTFENNIKYMTYRDIRSVPDNPERMDFIQSRKRELAFHLARLEALEAIDEQLRAEGGVRLRDQLGRTLLISGEALTPRPRGHLVEQPGGAPVRVERFDPEGRTVRWEADRAFFDASVEGDREFRSLELTLSLMGASAVTGDQLGAAGKRDQLDFPALTLWFDPTADFMELPIPDLLAEADRRIGAETWGAGTLVGPRNELEGRVVQLGEEVFSKIHERAALSVSVIVVMMAGTIAAMRLRHSDPLAVYLLSFIPALAILASVSGGQHMLYRQGLEGLMVLWGGIVVMGALTIVGYRGLVRH